MQYQFPGSKKRSIEVKNSKGEILRTYYLDMGNAETLKKALNNFKELDAMATRLKSVDVPTGENVDDILTRQKAIVDDLLGDYEILWQECGENIFAMNSFVKAVIGEVAEAVKQQNEI